MTQNPVNNNLNKIFIGSLIWGVFYIQVFFNESTWSSSLFGQLFQNSYSYVFLYVIQIVFFFFLSFNLFHYTIGKKYSLFGIDQFFKVVIFSSLLVLIVQSILIYFDLPFHFGLIGYLSGNANIAQMFESPSNWIYILYSVSTILMSIYITGILVYVYQIKKMNLDLSFSMLVRIGVILYLFGLSLGATPDGFKWIQLGFGALYIIFAFLVYIRTKFSLKALFLSLIILFIL